MSVKINKNDKEYSLGFVPQSLYDDVEELKEEKTSKTDIAAVESGTTASRAYSVGELVYVSGTLYRVKAAIASGATFTVGTNIEVTSVGSAINDKVSKTVTSTQTMAGNLILDRANGTTSSNGSSAIQVGNNIPSGTDGNSRGYVELYGTGSYFARLRAGNITEQRNIDLPDKSGTIALLSDVDTLSESVQSLKFPRQKNLGTFTSQAQLETFLSNMGVSSGKFDGDIQIGDYVTIAGYKCIVAGFDTEYNKGDTALTTHHISFIANLGNSKMNKTDTTTGGYEGATTMQSFLSGKETELNAICGSHLLSRRCMTTNSVGTDGKSNNWAWIDHKLTLMSETQIYGGIQWGNVYDTGEGYEKLPIFNYLTPVQVFGRAGVWLRGVYSATDFCLSHYYGRPLGYKASDSFAAGALFCIG